MEWLKNNQSAMLWIMAVAVFLVTFVLKFPIKIFTKRISNENVRKSVNSIILLIPFALGILVQFIYSRYFLHIGLDILEGLKVGTASITMYAIIERVLGFKINNPYKKLDVKIIEETIGDIVEDKKLDIKDIDTVKNALDKLNNAD